MAQVFMGSGITVATTGKSQATSGASAGATLPNASSGEVPHYVIVSATASAYFRMGSGAQTAVAGDLMIQPGDARILSVPVGYTNFACIQVTAAGVLQISPLENM